MTKVVIFIIKIIQAQVTIFGKLWPENYIDVTFWLTDIKTYIVFFCSFWKFSFSPIWVYLLYKVQIPRQQITWASFIVNRTIIMKNIEINERIINIDLHIRWFFCCCYCCCNGRARLAFTACLMIDSRQHKSLLWTPSETQTSSLACDVIYTWQTSFCSCCTKKSSHIFDINFRFRWKVATMGWDAFCFSFFSSLVSFVDACLLVVYSPKRPFELTAKRERTKKEKEALN